MIFMILIIIIITDIFTNSIMIYECKHTIITFFITIIVFHVLMLLDPTGL